MSTLRERIVEIAREEASPPPFGKVSDLVLDSEGNRAGWQRLKQYFDEAVDGWSLDPNKWSGKGQIKLITQPNLTLISFLDGIKKPMYRVPQGESKLSGVSWCGIFATWVMRQAGVKNARWIADRGIRGDGVSMVNDTKGFQIGDVIVIRSGEIHHAIVAEMPSIYDQDSAGNLDTSIVTVNGNSTNQSIRVHSEYKLSDVAYYYRVPDNV